MTSSGRKFNIGGKITLTNQKVRVFSLGGVGEIGKNMYIVEIDNSLFVIDAGLMFPSDDMLGIDIVIPDMTYLEQNSDKVKAIFITHGHEDHIGSLPYLLQKLSVPVYGTQLTIGIIKKKLEEHQLDKNVSLQVIDSETLLTIDHIKIHFFRTNHSIPDSIGICIDTEQGSIVHTGDFKFDQTPVDGVVTDYAKLAKIGNDGVLCLLSDSTNAERPGLSLSESYVGQGIQEAFLNAKGRIIVATFASNVHRVQQVFNAAVKENRKVFVSGRSMEKIVSIATELGYLKFPETTLQTLGNIDQHSDDEIVVLTTGSQGEPLAALSRMARGAHRQISIKQTDTIIISATPIPGNEKSVMKIVDLLYRTGADVIFGKKNVHASGHGFAEELKLMITLMKPRYFMPVHGEYRMQVAHAELAKRCGVTEQNIFLVDKGDVVEFQDQCGKKFGKVPSGNILIDGIGVGDVGHIVLRDRRLLSQDGIIVVVVSLDKENNTLLSGPDIVSRGFVYVRESEELLHTATDTVKQIVQRCLLEQACDWAILKSNIRDQLGKFLFDKTRRRPMILPIIMEV